MIHSHFVGSRGGAANAPQPPHKVQPCFLVFQVVYEPGHLLADLNGF